MRVSAKYLRVVVAIILVGCLSFAQAAQVALEYTGNPRTFKVCALNVQDDATAGTWGNNAHPLIFEGLRRCPEKPAGWDFENPLAAPQVVSGLGNLTKADAAYWTVSLTDETAAGLQGLDLIYICQTDIDITSSSQREALIKAVRTGTIIWVDQADAGGSGTAVSAFAPPGPANRAWAAFNFGPAGTGNSRGAVNAHGWLLQNPCKISAQEAYYIGRYPRPSAPTEGASNDVVLDGDDGAGNPVDFDAQPVLWVSAGTNATITPYGSGAIVVTAGEVGYDLESWWQATGYWWSADRLRRPSRYQLPDFKFAYNILAATSRWSQARRGPSADAKSVVEVRPPLQIDWQFPGQFESITTNSIGPVVGSPVCAGGMVFANALGTSGGNSYLLCFDADPAQDLDGDGTADDGVLDYSAGAPYDLVWSDDLGSMTPRYASACVADVFGLDGYAYQQAVLVSLVDPSSGDAEVRCYNTATGALIWTYAIDGYGGAQVVALSTPVVYQDYVYVLASEFDSGLAGSDVNSTYGRAHCFQLSYDWDADTDGPRWVFPDSNTDPAEDGDDASDSGAPDDHAFAELQGMLPPFHEPQWVAGIAPYDSPAPRPLLPPTPGAIPVPHSGQDVIADSEWEVMLNIATPVGSTFSWDGVAEEWNMSISGWTDLLDRSGGYDFALIPTPTTPPAGAGDPPQDQLNSGYYSSIRLTNGLPSGTSGPTAATHTVLDSLTRLDDTDIDVSATLVNVGSTVRVYFTSGQARELLLPARRDGSSRQRPHNISYYGVPLEVTYTVDTTGDGTPDTQYTDRPTLRGPMRYRLQETSNRRRVTPPVITGPDSMITVSDAAENADREVASANGGALSCRSRYSSSQQWQFHADTTLPNASTLPSASFDPPYDPYTYAPLYKSAPAIDTSTDTAYVVVNHAQPDPSNDTSLEGVAEVIGVATEADLTIVLRPVDGGTAEPDARLREGTVTITTLDTAYDNEVALPASAYEIDYENHTITFNRSQAGWVSGTVGSLYGKPVWVTYDFCDPADPTDPGNDTTITNELHILPEVVRFQYMPGFIRLHHNFVYHNFDDSADAMNISLSLPNGIALTGLGIGEEEFDDAGLLPSGWTDALARGILDIRNLQIPTPGTDMPLQPGCNIVVQYYYFDETTGETVAATETHQVPYDIGESISSPALGGRVLHVGTEGFDPNRDNTLNLTEDHNDSHVQKPFLVGDRIKETLLSLLWDPISNLVYGHMAQPANPHGSYNVLGTPVVPAVSSSPVLGHNRVFVGSKMVGQITQPASGYVSEGVGFVSALKSRSTFICDDTRIIEVIEDTPVWVCHGTLSAMPNEAVDVSRGTDERIAIPFNRPAKALPLSNGNLLVVDTGNNRVVEIDRNGVVKWPLSSAGYDYYTSGTNTQLRLDSPSDVFRYYTITDSGVNYNSTNGDLLPSTTTHTVIADAGNGRVIDIVTAVNASGQQSHSVHVKTPSHVKPAGSTAPLQRIAYTAVRPIFDPAPDIGDYPAGCNTVHPVIGYLCAASNLHQLVVVEENTLAINPPSANPPYCGSTGSNWNWLAWLWDEDVSDTIYGPPNSLIFRNIRDLQTSYEGGDFYITVTCGQYAGRLGDRLPSGQVQPRAVPHELAAQGDGIFEFCVDISGDPGDWALISALDGGGGATPDTPIWHMTREDYIYSYPATSVRRDLSNIRYIDVDDNPYWQTMPWFPVSAVRLPCDNRPMNADGTAERYHRHLITNYAGLIPNLTRENVNAVDLSAPASLYSSVIVVQTDDRNDDQPSNDILDIDRRLVTPNPNEADWPDPLAQPTHAAR